MLAFDVQSLRYTGNQFIDVVEGKKNIEDVFYLRPVGYYSDRGGKRYYYSPEQGEEDLKWCLEAAKRYNVDSIRLNRLSGVFLPIGKA